MSAFFFCIKQIALTDQFNEKSDKRTLITAL
jgi:hypothetical protein